MNLEIQKLILKSIKQQHFEILAISITAILKFLLMDWLNWRGAYLAVVFLFWLIYIYLQVKKNKEILKLWGFKKEHFRQTILFLMPLIVLAIIAFVNLSSSSIRLTITWQFIIIFCLYPFWGILQQFIMLGIISNNIVTINKGKINTYLLIILIATLFSLIHYPSYFLMVFTFLLEAVFVIVYLKWRNLWAIGIAHGWIATFLLYFVMERDLWNELVSSF